MKNCHIIFIIFLMFYFHNSHQLMITALSSSSFITQNHTHIHGDHHSLCPPHQSLALLQFKSNFEINSQSSFDCDIKNGVQVSYPKTETWKEGTDCCSSWDGVTCDSLTGHVIGIDLSCSQLDGTIHSNNSLFSSHIAHNLQMLNLSRNDFKMSNMSSLIFGIVKFSSSSLTHLDLSNSNFSGNIPSEISQLSNLVVLDLSWNFGGLRVESESVLKMIAQNLTHLRVLHLDDVHMSPSLQASFSSSLMNLSSSLISLSLTYCQLQGKFPDSFFLFPNLQELSLSNNNFNLVTSLPKLNTTSLRILNLKGMSFSPSIGFLDFVANLRSLRQLYLLNCSLSGPIPSSFGNLTKLTQLYLFSNYLSGAIPDSFSNMTQLSFLDLGDNQLEGPLPSCLFDLPSLESVSLSSNKLHGQIPVSVFKCVSLTYLTLFDNNLSGSLDFGLFLDLKKLMYLDLSSNNLSSNTAINTNLSYVALPNLFHLDLSSCNLSELPTFIRALTNLSYLDISSNKIHGEIPKWMSNVGKYSLAFDIDLSQNLFHGPLLVPSTTTRVFSVSKNSLNGEVSSQICDLTSLEVLDLSDNHFRGLIPPCLGNFSDSISALNLQMNDFQGTIPNTFAKCKELAYLNLNANQFRGTLPRSLVNCESLQVLDVNDNMIEDTFPYWLETLSELQVLTLRSNKFFGSINHLANNFPKGYLKTSFSSLRILDLSTNNLSGPLPERLIAGLKGMMKLSDGEGVRLEYLETILEAGILYSFSAMVTMKGFGRQLERILTIFTTIDLSNNNFEGEIPQVFGKLSLLKGLNLSHNSLTACIPLSIGDLVDNEWLDLSNNKLDGQIPQQLVNLKSLAVFNVSNNNLHGPIPLGKQFNTFGGDSYQGNFGLCGFPLSKCGSDQENQPPPPTEDASNSGIEFDWKIILIGYGCGTIFGLSMGYVVFTVGSPKWFVKIVEGKGHRSMKKSMKKAKRVGGTRN